MEKRIMRGKEVTEALKLRSQIKNESNILLRKARSNQFEIDDFEEEEATVNEASQGKLGNQMVAR